MFKCPKCGAEQEGYNDNWHEFVGFPLICQKCEKMFWVKMRNEALVIVPTTMPVEIPPLEVGTRVYLDNREHEFHLSPGIVVDKDHIHYRVKISYYSGETRHTVLWVPQHWVKPMPTWLSQTS